MQQRRWKRMEEIAGSRDQCRTDRNTTRRGGAFKGFKCVALLQLFLLPHMCWMCGSSLPAAPRTAPVPYRLNSQHDRGQFEQRQRAFASITAGTAASFHGPHNCWLVELVLLVELVDSVEPVLEPESTSQIMACRRP